MASDESMTVVSSTHEDEYDDIDVGFDHEQDHHSHPHNLSRLSMCTSSMYTNEDDDDDNDIDEGQMGLYMSRLSIESFDADVDEEFSEFSSDSDKELPNCYSLPATPPRRRNRTGGLSQQLMMGDLVKEYASENEAHQKGVGRARPRGRKDWRKRRVIRERWGGDGDGDGDGDLDFKERRKKDGEMMMMMMGSNNYSNNGSVSGESEGGGSVVVITRPKGGRRSLCMDLEEVKACRDLGFELEHERMLEMPARLSLETSSGGNSPIANWRISSPGDDPRDVKARLKVWAQAVALASTSRH